MQFLLAQLVYMKNSKASLKSLDRHCTDLEAYEPLFILRYFKADRLTGIGTTPGNMSFAS
jgi:hypothetical protein